MSAAYQNPWHEPGGKYGPAKYETTAKPVKLGKYVRYQRIPGNYDFVYEGVCFAQRAGPATEAMIDADKYAQGNLLRFCGVKFGPTWDDPEAPKFQPGDKVTLTNDYGAVFTGKTIVEVDGASAEPRYFIAPTDTPWFSFAEKNLTKVAA